MFTLTKEKAGKYKKSDSFFGLELEMCVCDKDRSTRGMFFRDKSYINDVFIRVFNEDDDESSLEALSEKNVAHNYYSWNVVIDTSVLCEKNCGLFETYHRLELISPIIEYNKDGLELVENAIDKLLRKFTFEITRHQGMHLNMSYYGQEKDMQKQNYKRALNFFKAWYFYEPQILGFLPPFRLEIVKKYAVPLHTRYESIEDLEDDFEDDLEAREGILFRGYKYNKGWPVKYSAINLKKDRFEVRVLPPTMNKKVIFFWIRLCMLLLEKSATFSAKKAPKDLLDYIDIKDYVVKYAKH